MTPDRRTNRPEDDDDALGVLDDTGAVDTTAIGVLGLPTAQVSVLLPGAEEEDLSDDDVVDDDPYALVMDEDPAALVREPDAVGRIHQGSDIADAHAVIALAEAGRITVPVERFKLDRVHDAYEALAAGALAGRAVVIP